MQKETKMPRLSAQGLIALILVGTLTLAQAAGPAIGVAVAEGSFRVDNSEVYGNTTLFDGAIVQTEKASSRLQLKNGTRMDLGADSRARIFEKRMTLEQGQGDIETSSRYQMDARTLRISPIDPKSIARVKLEGSKQVLVAAVNGRVRVFNESGQLVANMEPGVALMFTPQAAQAGTFQMSGCLLETKDGKFFLMDSNQTVELRGSGLASEINNRVTVSGTAFRSATPTPPATQVVQVESVNQTEAGGCLESISKLESAGLKVEKGPGRDTVVPKRAEKSHAGIYAGVAVAVAGGIGAAIALGKGGKSSTSP